MAVGQSRLMPHLANLVSLIYPPTFRSIPSGNLSPPTSWKRQIPLEEATSKVQAFGLGRLLNCKPLLVGHECTLLSKTQPQRLDLFLQFMSTDVS